MAAWTWQRHPTLWNRLHDLAQACIGPTRYFRRHPSMFSKACEYGIRAAMCIAASSRSGERLGLKEVAERTGSPEAFTAKVVRKLVEGGLIDSQRGPHGGFLISPGQARKIRISRIVDLIDGDAVYRGCGLGLEACDARKPCPLHDQFAKVRADLKRLLEGTTLHDVVDGVPLEKIILKR